MHARFVVAAAVAVASSGWAGVWPGSRAASAFDYASETNEPQKTGWPLTAEEEQYVLRPEHERRPGRERNQHLPHLWPVVPAAGSTHSAVRISPLRIAELVGAQWVDVCQTPDAV